MQNKFYLAFGRHERYGSPGTAIEREDMIAAYLSGRKLKNILPPCACVYHSPLRRAAETAHFEAAGLGCENLTEVDALIDTETSFGTRKFLNALLRDVPENVFYYHIVTHLPVLEKLGLPFAGTGEIYLLTAENSAEMLAENFTLQKIQKPQVTAAVWRKLKLTPQSLQKMSADEIYSAITKVCL